MNQACGSPLWPTGLQGEVGRELADKPESCMGPDPLLSFVGLGLYQYMPHLRVLEQRHNKAPVPVWLRTVASPLNPGVWAQELANHQDQSFRDYILGGISRGFHIGFDYAGHTCRPATSNMVSASEYPEVVQAYLDKEVALGRVVGPVDLASVPEGTQLSPFGVIPKSQPGKWRLIVDLSSPDGGSVNDGIEPELCSLQYLRLDEVVRKIVHMGQGTVMAKMDIESAYRIMPVHPSDRLLLGVQWKGGVFFDTRLPFGLRSAPKIFTAVADALQWICQENGVSWVAHYLDDFITLGVPRSQECQVNMERILSVCRRLGVPVAPSKCEGPATVLVFLGFEIDSDSLVVRLPEEKLRRTKAKVAEWVDKKACKKRDLESLLGHLQHAATVVRPGRTFVRRLIELLSTARRSGRWIRLNASTRSDLRWWLEYMEQWNGVFLMPRLALPAISVESDASGSWGCGARWGAQWFQWRWWDQVPGWLIAPKELLPILFAVAVWGPHWVGRLVVCHCDNMAVVSVVNSGYSRDPTLMHLLRCLFFMVAHFQIQIKAVHVTGVTNVAADALSRNDLPRFLQAVPEAAWSPTPIPQGLVDLLIRECPDWTSPRWAQLFSGCFRLG